MATSVPHGQRPVASGAVAVAHPRPPMCSGAVQRWRDG